MNLAAHSCMVIWVHFWIRNWSFIATHLFIVEGSIISNRIEVTFCGIFL